MPRRGVFIAGTDTGVGKTTFSRALLRMAANANLRVAPVKPVESGVGPDGPSDARALRAAARSSLSLDEVCPHPFRLPVAPVVAARAEGVALDVARLAAHCLGLQPSWPLLVESAGGLLSPLTDRGTNADLAQHLGLPVVLVARNSLGTINHTALALAELRRRALSVAAVALVSTMPDGPDAATNAACITTLCETQVLGPLPYLPGGNDDTLAAALTALPRAGEILLAHMR